MGRLGVILLVLGLVACDPGAERTIDFPAPVDSVVVAPDTVEVPIEVEEPTEVVEPVAQVESVSVNGYNVRDLPLDPARPEGARQLTVLPQLQGNQLVIVTNTRPLAEDDITEEGQDLLARGMVPPFWGHVFVSTRVDGYWSPQTPSVRFPTGMNFLPGESVPITERFWQVSNRSEYSYRIHITPREVGDEADVTIVIPVIRQALPEEGETWINVTYQSPFGDGFNALIPVDDAAEERARPARERQLELFGPNE